jgi:phosphate acyltransferase
LRIGIDLMGSESSPTVLFEAVLNAANDISANDSLVVFTTHSALQKILSEERFQPFLVGCRSIVDLHLVQEEITMQDDPLSALRLKKESSLVVGIKQLREKRIDAFVSAGNSGALVGCASLILEKMRGMDRPCLLASLPTRKEHLAILDVGGYLSPQPEQLLQYARAGAAYQRALLGKSCPTVGLMNIGVESKKGTPEVRSTYQLLEQDKSGQFRFIGNIEGREAFQGEVDVLVTDGFTGNVILKVSQGVSSFIFDFLHEAVREMPYEEVHSLVSGMHGRFRYDEHPGALLCGVEGLVIKSHGAATVRSMHQSILGAKKLFEAGIVESISKDLFII